MTSYQFGEARNKSVIRQNLAIEWVCIYHFSPYDIVTKETLPLWACEEPFTACSQLSPIPSYNLEYISCFVDLVRFQSERKALS